MGELGMDDEGVQEIGHLALALESVVATMLGDLVRTGVLDRSAYIEMFKTSEDQTRQRNHHAAAIAVFRRLRRSLEDAS
jgi:hypothetical protein